MQELCELEKDLLSAYFNIYYLKPFDAVNDAANAFAFQQMEWVEPVCEIGSGDGVFSFVMHGGRFGIEFDRYQQTDPNLDGDIYDVFDGSDEFYIKKQAKRKYALGIDFNKIHLAKCRKLGFYENLLSAPAENLSDVPEKSFNTVFFYTYHGLKDYTLALREAWRILRNEGRLLILVYTDCLKESFVFYPWSRSFQENACEFLYFDALDNGRFCELTNYSRSPQGWIRLFRQTGFEPLSCFAQVSPVAWKFYDTQSRIFLRDLIRMDHALSKEGIKLQFKRIFSEEILNSLHEFYLNFARPRPVNPGESVNNIYLAFELKKTGKN